MTEINKDFYCSAGQFDGGMCFIRKLPTVCHSECIHCHRKWPTVSQFEAEYGFKYPDDGAVYLMIDGAWTVAMYHFAQNAYKGNPVVVACTPFGKPPDSWRPE